MTNFKETFKNLKLYLFLTLRNNYFTVIRGDKDVESQIVDLKSMRARKKE